MRLIYTNPNMKKEERLYTNPEKNAMVNEYQRMFKQSLNKLRSDGKLDTLEVLILKLRFGMDYAYDERNPDEIADYLNKFSLTKEKLTSNDVFNKYIKAKNVLRKNSNLFEV